MTSKIKVDNINKVSDDSNIINKCGTTITLGASGDSVDLAAGASQTGFGRTGTVNWDTTKKTTGFTAVSGNGYFCDTAASGAFTLTLPSSPSAGDIVGMKDYNGNFATANLTIGRGGSPINGANVSDVVIDTAGAAIFLVYVDGSQGWVATQDDSSTFAGESWICASVSGACNTIATAPCCANTKIATFLGPGTFTVNGVSGCAANNLVSYMVVAGGGGSQEGAGGAGGFRELVSPTAPYSASPLDGYPSAPNRVTVTATPYPITVGAGGAAGTPIPNPAPPATTGQPGFDSVFSTITSTGGGGGGKYTNNPGDRNAGIPGGSGGGSAAHPNPAPQTAGGTGNTPPTTPPQGNNGGPSNGGYPNFAGGGGGASAVGTTGSSGGGAPGGAGVTSTITGTPVGRAGGGGGGLNAPTGTSPSPGFGGGTGACTTGNGATAGTDNTGGGAGGTWSAPGLTGGSGIVVIRYKFQ
tara:strand:- start:1399 stop:2805 length:1407 start_codon:yes stop_codon:yes gene_type:complete